VHSIQIKSNMKNLDLTFNNYPEIQSRITTAQQKFVARGMSQARASHAAADEVCRTVLPVCSGQELETWVGKQLKKIREGKKPEPVDEKIEQAIALLDEYRFDELEIGQSRVIIFDRTETRARFIETISRLRNGNSKYATVPLHTSVFYAPYLTEDGTQNEMCCIRLVRSSQMPARGRFKKGE
jgi:hypothetical protein